MNTKKALFYIVSFISVSFMFIVCYYFSYKNALKQFNAHAIEQNKELILSLEKDGLLQAKQETGTKNTDTADETNAQTADNSREDSVAAEASQDTILPTTKYILQTYNTKTGNLEEETLPIPSYLVGLTRQEVIDYLYNYMQDLSWNEYEKGLTSFELMKFSPDDIVLRKGYNPEQVVNKYYLKSVNGYIVVYYGDKKTVYDYTSVSVKDLTQSEQQQLEEGIYVKDEDELYAVLENYSS